MTKDPKSIAFYLRVSTTSQDFKAQMHALREFCRRKGWPGPTKANLFSEKKSGMNVKRRELDYLLQSCRNGLFDTIITYRVDRLGRSMVHLVNIFAELKRIGIRVIGAADSIDTATDTPEHEALRNMLATFAQLNREKIVDNIRDGLAAAAKQGRFPGRPRKKEKQIAQAIKLRAEGLGVREIHQRTGLSLGYVSKILNESKKAS